MKSVYLSIGSNINNPIKQIINAIINIKNIPYSKIIDISTIYYSKPYKSIKKQKNYLNAVILIKTKLNPYKILHYINKIEKKQGRIRTKFKWDSRSIDIDIILFENFTINNKKLTIPHYDMKNRSFVITPILEINSNIKTPEGESIHLISKKLSKKNIYPYFCLLKNNYFK
ncbi:2-amino-4-hydroxy-6-hydroxymethyldihydropteridinepyrophosphokinase [Buchnera aphidicola (Neophyllaphis podocarpi)]|uniref:2-amino-4-hydroxy-6- hydroxymethyldihydropteridine diphosphokinase n=1 Tax=Buchnera aphidicola TaxID=9 RepID=UPI003463CDEC